MRLLRDLVTLEHVTCRQIECDFVTFRIVNDKRNFPKMLYKAMERHFEMERAVQLMSDRERNGVNGKLERIEEDGNELMVDMSSYEQILSVIIVNLCALEEDGQRYRVDQDLNKQTQSAVAVIMRKCDKLNVDEKSRSMIRQFFAGYFSPNEMLKIDVCGLGPSLSAGCLVQ